MSKTKNYRAFVALAATALVCLISACNEDAPCDEDQILVNGYCVPGPADAAVTAPPTSGIDASVPAVFGQICTTTAECVAPTNFCSIIPGDASGTCTASGCEVDPSICPATWTCLDLTPFGQALHICIPPA